MRGAWLLPAGNEAARRLALLDDGRSSDVCNMGVAFHIAVAVLATYRPLSCLSCHVGGLTQAQFTQLNLSSAVCPASWFAFASISGELVVDRTRLRR